MSHQETDSPQLSQREMDVLKLVATGASNQQIANDLVISINTVKVHLRNTYEKLGVQSRTEAVMVAVQEGWVTVSDDAPVSGSPPQTFLIADPHPTLTTWQQFYLIAAILLAAVTVVVPLLLPEKELGLPLPIEKTGDGKIFPIQPPTPTPVVLNTNPSSRWTYKAPISDHRGGLAVVTFEDKIYAVGGVKANNKATRSMEIYDPTANIWEEGTGKPTAVTSISAVMVGDNIYTPGGCTNDGQAIDTLEIYNPQSDAWHTGNSLPDARCGYGLVALEDKIYLFGGWDGDNFTDTVFIYSVKDDAWHIADTPMPQAKGYMGATVLDDTIYVAGGYDGDTEFNQVYIFQPETAQWQETTPMNETRGGLGLISAAKNLYAVGGGWKQAAVSEKYDPATKVWTPFETPFTDQWRNAGLTAINAEIYVVGGWNDTKDEYMDSVVSYQTLYQLFIPISTFGGQQ